MHLQGRSTKKKAYNRPNMFVYGDISQITQNQNDPELFICDNHPSCGGTQKTGYNG